ncbi:ATP-binding protein [Halanaeroarchaeum sp. HSR-CO]|uniref:ATP-binding protein n=1 Tax=Halanaeroarchaeum sp. HSR-CO TaxID=2866382 RepID=UPI00217D5E6D|nr:ATP-binding protein [Halanaeroarchaeum sp. HSR-CO]
MNSTDGEDGPGDASRPDESVEPGDVLSAFQSIHDVTTNSALSFEEKIDRLLTIGVDATGLPYGFLSRITVDERGKESGVQQIYRSQGDHERLQPGESAPLSKAYCRKTIQSDSLLTIQNAVDDGWEGDPAYETFDLGSYIGGRVDVDDELYGTFCFAATEPRERAFSEAERTLVQVLAKWASYELEQERAKRGIEAQRDGLARAQDELRQVIDLVPDLLFAKNREGRYLLANEATANAYGKTIDEIEGSTEDELLPERSESEDFREDDIAVIESGEPKFIPAEELTTADGETRILDTTKIPFEVAGSGEDAVLGYARDVTELKEYERELETQRDNLEVLSQVVRHDIRNDLQLVLAYGEMLQSQVEGDGAQYVDQVLAAARDAVDITTTAREVADVVLQSGVDQHPKRLRHVIEEAVDNVRESNRSGLVTVDGPIPEVAVRADDMLESVFRNLLKNAIIHNDKTVPEVEVGAAVDDDTAVVRVADNGPGIPEDRKETIFEEGEMGLDSDGTGLGLYLVDTLVDRYDGDVYVEDNDPVGSVFVVELSIAE